mmetsp:Transcript_28290/g.67246  ORF Transcript_28290/g.67246 Transcript_28290/m.67246 type:complete len:292 (-) Transcript_28290:3068-3943(-)
MERSMRKESTVVREQKAKKARVKKIPPALFCSPARLLSTPRNTRPMLTPIATATTECIRSSAGFRHRLTAPRHRSTSISVRNPLAHDSSSRLWARTPPGEEGRGASVSASESANSTPPVASIRGDSGAQRLMIRPRDTGSETTCSMWSATGISAGQGNPASEKWLDTSLGGPWKTLCPSASRSTLSSFWKAAGEGWWMVRTTIRPAAAMSRRLPMREAAANESSPLVGSSSMMTEGCVTISMAMLTLRRSPPEMPRPPPPAAGAPIFELAMCDTRSSSIVLLTSWSTSSRV